jgi:zinc transporter 1/2/3
MLNMDLKLLKIISIFILFISSFLFSNIPILISYIIKKYLIKYKIKLSNNQIKRLTTNNQLCCNKLVNTDQLIDDSDNETELKIEISIKKYFKNYNLISTYITCFASGIFLSTSMLELLPNVVKNMKDVQQMMFETNSKPTSTVFKMQHEMPDFKNSTVVDLFKSRLVKFPLGEFFIVLGVFFVMTLEQLIIFYNEKRQEKNLKLKHKYENLSNIDEATMLIEDGWNKNNGKLDENSVVKTRIIVLLIALSIHSIFEGLTIGLQVHYNTLVNVLIAIIVHKCLIAFSFGQQLVENFNKFGDKKLKGVKGKLSYKYLILSNFIFSISNPIGIIIAVLIVDIYANMFSTLVISLIQAVSCGTFIYITFFEILPHELNNNLVGLRLLKVFFIFIGFLLFSFIIFLN